MSIQEQLSNTDGLSTGGAVTCGADIGGGGGGGVGVVGVVADSVGDGGVYVGGGGTPNQDMVLC